MRFSKEHKAETRARIVEKAAAMLRRDGLEGVSVPGLMKEAGLTHGGFYAHFASKDALVAAAVDVALGDLRERFGALALNADDPLTAIVDAYVSVDHRDHPEAGCAMAAIGAETARDSSEGGRAVAEGARRTVKRLQEALGARGLSVQEDDVIALFASMVGAIVVSRACGADPEMSDRVLAICRERLKRLPAVKSQDPPKPA